MSRRVLLTLLLVLGLATPALAQSAGNIDTPAANATVGQPFTINGWAIYQGGSGSGVDVVHIYGCPTLNCGTPTFWGAATYGLASPGVAAFYGSAFGNAAYSFVMSGLAPAQYTIQIYAHNTVTNSWTVFERTTTVTATPLHTIETPTTNQGVTQPFALTGWAIDGSNPTGTGVDAVDVSGYHNFGSGSPLLSLGSATYSCSRPAVSALYGARFDPSGYTKTLSTLTAGWYWFVVSSHNVRDNSWTVRTQTAFVDIPTSTLNITRGGTGTGGITASPSMVSCPGGSTTQAMPCPEATYTTGTMVTLTAVPDAGSTFAGWVGACSGTAPCPILLNGARHVTAMFSKIPGSIETRYYHTDVIGSVRAITDETGAVVIRRDYAPFGQDSNPDLAGDPMRFAGKELDPETGMNYFAARYYRNTWGRFASVDPLHVPAAMVDPQQWNRYAYARNNPLAFTDPSGLCTMRSDNISDGCTEEVTVTASGGSIGAATRTTPSAGTPSNPLLSNGIGNRPGNNTGAQTFINANGVCGWAHPDDPSELYFTGGLPGSGDRRRASRPQLARRGAGRAGCGLHRRDGDCCPRADRDGGRRGQRHHFGDRRGLVWCVYLSVGRGALGGGARKSGSNCAKPGQRCSHRR